MKKILLLGGLAIYITLNCIVGCTYKTPINLANFTTEQINSPKTVYLDFSKTQGLPLFKKIAMFSIGWVDGSRMTRTLDQLQSLRPIALRMDMGMGYAGMGAAIGLGTEKAVTSNFSALTNYSKLLQGHEVMPYWCYYSIPKAAQKKNSKDPVHDGLGNTGTWEKICEDTAAALKKSNIRVYGHEIGNEPDFSEFFKGTWNEYIDIYKYGSIGIRKADPDAVIGGLSLAFPMTSVGSGYVDEFLISCRDNKTPLDFVSYHSYNNEEILSSTTAIRTVLSEYKEFNRVRLHVTEYNTSFNAETSQNYASAAKFFGIAGKINELTDIEIVNWACFLSPYDNLGILSLNGDNPYAIYHAIEFYNNMPYQRAKTIENLSQVQVTASYEDDRVCVVLYNQSDREETVNALLDNFSFKKGILTEYLIDKSHSSYYDMKDSNGKLYAVRNEEIDTGSGFSWNGSVAGHSVVLFEIKAPNAKSELNNRPNPGDFVRRDYYYSDRNKNLFAETDLLNYITYMGMNSNTEGTVSTSLTFDNTIKKINMDILKFGDLSAASTDAYCGVRVDFQGGNGYQKSIYYNLGEFNEQTEMSPVSIKKADIVKKINKNSFVLDIEKTAPDDFTGRIVITYGMKNCKADAMVKLCLKTEN